jgi:hypothetical protein
VAPTDDCGAAEAAPFEQPTMARQDPIKIRSWIALETRPYLQPCQSGLQDRFHQGCLTSAHAHPTAIIMPSTVKVRIKGARNLPMPENRRRAVQEAPTFRSRDPYVVVSIGGTLSKNPLHQESTAIAKGTIYKTNRLSFKYVTIMRTFTTVKTKSSVECT